MSFTELAVRANNAEHTVEQVYDWLVDDLGFPYDMHTKTMPAWLDLDRLVRRLMRTSHLAGATYEETLGSVAEETDWPQARRAYRKLTERASRR